VEWGLKGCLTKFSIMLQSKKFIFSFLYVIRKSSAL
jgi:hypothetical protein